jgi:inosine/xanthosine triphosphatase
MKTYTGEMSMSNERPPEIIEIAVGSANPTKIGAVEIATERYLPNVTVLPADVLSDVPDQPWGDEETSRGAENRARAALQLHGSELGIGIESGLSEGPGGRLYAVSWVVVVDQKGRTGIGASERFSLPEEIAARLRSGNEELGNLIDQTLPNTAGRARLVGAVNVITGSRRDRMDLLTNAVILALADLLEPWRTG